MRTLFKAAIAAAFLSLIGVGSHASEVTQPRHYAVVNVASNDVLNVRSAPSSKSDIVGSLAPNAAPVEVFRVSGNWGYIVHGEANGWVSRKFLAPVSLPRIKKTQLNVGLICVGAEPFWSLEVSTISKLRFETPEQTRSFAVVDSGPSAGRPDKDFVWASDGGVSVAGVVERRICSDTMSDRAYPMSVNLVFNGGGQSGALSGCCYTPTN
ncbi:MAG: SH3 domain-containing protein [Pseudomonadota bacterium]